ncbi:MFS transporter [Vagococcus acidifermentans]|uniref:MFS transporter n=1 Tax=Vagococcus acidifermentans TaxID=564710 RepID=A0A430ASV6_9ENTE|nr:MFS transporter [Vagococcus acidifermentans]RSU11130.1 MFS transporter [Vagococcus acidifermentans]
MTKKIILILFINTMVAFSTSLFQMNILWQMYTVQSELNTIVSLIASSFILQAIFSLTAGILVDKFSKKKLLLLSLVSYNLIVVSTLFLDGKLNTLLAYLAVTIITTVYQRALITLVASNLTSNDYIKYDSVNSIVIQATTILNTMLAGVIITYLGMSFIFIIVFLLLWISFVLIFLSVQELQSNNTERLPEAKKKSYSLSSILRFIKVNVLSDKKIMIFILILFLLNLDYGYIPNILPFYMLQGIKNHTAIELSLLKSSVNIGEVLGSLIVVTYSHKVSLLTKIGLIGSACSFLALPFTKNFVIFTFLILLFYGFFDTLTQPIFSYFVSSIDNQIRGRVLGITDSVVFLSAPLGMFFGNQISQINQFYLTIYLVSIFVVSFIIINKSGIYSNIDLKKG